MLYDCIEQSSKVCCLIAPVGAHPVVLCRAVKHGEVELLLCCLKREHKVKDHFVYLLGAAVWLVHLVYHNNGLQTDLQCLLQHKACLWHGAFEGIDKENTAVGHVEHALDLAAEVAVTRSVDNVDFGVFISYRYIL